MNCTFMNYEKKVHYILLKKNHTTGTLLLKLKVLNIPKISEETLNAAGNFHLHEKGLTLINYMKYISEQDHPQDC